MADAFATYPSLKDKVIFVTGGASGIGATFVTEFHAQGSKVAFVDLKQEDGDALMAKLGGDAWFQQCDVTDVAALQGAIGAAGKALGPVTVLINNVANDTRQTTAEMITYVAAKGAINAMTKGLAREWGVDEIRVNTLSPGWIITERQLELWLTPEAEAEWMQLVALKERIMPADVARLAMFLSADDSRMITGQNVVIDGGRT